MNNTLVPVEYSNLRVLTSKQLADFYNADDKVIRQNFNNNKDKFVLGRDYFLLTGEDLKEFKLHVEIFDAQISNMTRSLYLWTEYGTVLHAKSINTDEAWNVYFMLVDNYFRAKPSNSLRMFTFNDKPCTNVRQIAKKYRCSDILIQDYLKRIPLDKDYSYIMGEDLRVFKEDNKLDPHISCLYIIYPNGIAKIERFLQKAGFSHVDKIAVSQ